MRLLVILIALVSAAAAGEIKVTNLVHGETLRYPLALVRGELPAENLALTLTDDVADSKAWPAVSVGRRFLALVELSPGDNRLRLTAGDADARFLLRYQPQTNSRCVRVVYMTDSSGQTAYQTPDAGDGQSHAARLGLAMKLMQTFTAERMNDLGFGRKTFRIELDDRGQVPVHVLKGQRPAEFYYSLPDLEWYNHVFGELGAAFPDPKVKSLVLPAYTRFDAATRKVRGHTALGGNNLALFGSGALFTWPERLEAVFPAFADVRAIDGTIVHDDSAGRSTRWGLAATTMGAALHELGHTFELPHSRDPLDIMTRGFDHFNRVYSLIEPPGLGGDKPLEFSDTERAAFAPISAAALAANRWFALDDREFADDSPPTITADDSGQIIVRADHGLRYLGVNTGGDAADYRNWPGAAPVRAAFSLADLAAKAGTDEIVLRAIDAQGQSVSTDLRSLRRSVRTWKFSKLTRPWTDRNAFVDLGEADLKAIQQSAEASKLVSSPTGFIDMQAAYPGAGGNVAGYALRKFQVVKPLSAKLLAGSDDAIRLWLNGKLLHSNLVLRSAQPDEDNIAVELPAGEHRLLVEISQAGGGWGFFLRFETADGKPLGLNPAGELELLSP